MKHTEETKRRISETMKGHFPIWLKGQVPWNKGKRGFQKAWNKGKKMWWNPSRMKGKTPWNKGKKGLQIAWNKGKHLSEQTKHKLSLAFQGEKCNFWKGGISFRPYAVDWTRTLRRSIRERDKYTCFICKEMQTEKVFSVHHIDYNKLNCDPKNLITLCSSCHSKTNSNREYWYQYFTTQ